MSEGKTHEPYRSLIATAPAPVNTDNPTICNDAVYQQYDLTHKVEWLMSMVTYLSAENGMQALHDLTVLYLRFQRDPAFAALLEYDEFESNLSLMLPSFTVRCQVAFRGPQVPLDLPKLFRSVETLCEINPMPLGLFILRHHAALIELGPSRWIPR